MLRRLLFLCLVSVLGGGRLLCLQQITVDGVYEELDALSRTHPGRLQLEEWGRTGQDRPILLARIGRRRDGGTRLHMAGILVVAGLDGRRIDDVILALHHIRTFTEAPAGSKITDLLARATLYVLPMANPDGLAASSARPIEGNLAPMDADRDGREGEDPPDDLDGDGYIVSMRVPDPRGEWIVDPVEPRLMRGADNRSGGGLDRFRLLPEGVDGDRDGSYNEDPPGTVIPDRNFPHRYPEHEPGAGRHVLSEPEARALVELVLGKRNLRMVICYGPGENLLEKPITNSIEGRCSPNGILEEDAWLYEDLAKSYRELSGRRGRNAAQQGGSFMSWVYAQAGLPCLSTRLCHFADQTGPASAPEEPAEDDSGPDDRPDDRDRLAWLIRNFGEASYVAWHPVDHPELGRVEVGGIRRDLLHRIPPRMLEDVKSRHQTHLVSLFERMPQLEVAKVVSTQIGTSVFELKALITNQGWLAPRTAMAERLARPRAPIAELLIRQAGRRVLFTETGGARRLLFGTDRVLLKSLKGKGSHQELRWVLSAPQGSSVTLRVSQEGVEFAQKEIILQ